MIFRFAGWLWLSGVVLALFVCFAGLAADLGPGVTGIVSFCIAPMLLLMMFPLDMRRIYATLPISSQKLGRMVWTLSVIMGGLPLILASLFVLVLSASTAFRGEVYTSYSHPLSGLYLLFLGITGGAITATSVANPMLAGPRRAGRSNWLFIHRGSNPVAQVAWLKQREIGLILGCAAIVCFHILAYRVGRRFETIILGEALLAAVPACFAIHTLIWTYRHPDLLGKAFTIPSLADAAASERSTPQITCMNPRRGRLRGVPGRAASAFSAVTAPFLGIISYETRFWLARLADMAFFLLLALFFLFGMPYLFDSAETHIYDDSVTRSFLAYVVFGRLSVSTFVRALRSLPLTAGMITRRILAVLAVAAVAVFFVAIAECVLAGRYDWLPGSVTLAILIYAGCILSNTIEIRYGPSRILPLSLAFVPACILLFDLTSGYMVAGSVLLLFPAIALLYFTIQRSSSPYRRPPQKEEG